MLKAGRCSRAESRTRKFLIWTNVQHENSCFHRKNPRTNLELRLLQYQPGLIKNIYLCTFCATPVYVPYCTFRRSFKEKCPLSGDKTQVKYMNLGAFLLCRSRYILLCFITLLQKLIASLKVNALSCCKYALRQTQP